MISYLEGILVHKSPTEIIVDVNGVGYSVHIPLSTFEKLKSVSHSAPNSSGRIKIFTVLHVREDAMQLFGFATEAERELFQLLISISGIGPRIAQGILSGMDTSELRQCITSADVAALTTIQGVGRKTAERIVVELRDKLGKAEEVSAGMLLSSKQLSVRSQALNALLSLGYTRASAEAALRAVLKEQKELPLEEIIKHALRHTSR